MSAIATTDETFDTDQRSAITVVDFWAEWCGPCLVFKPQFEQVAPWFQATFVTGLLDDCEKVVTDLGVTTIPTVALYRDSELVAKISGALSQQQLLDFLAANGVHPDQT